MNKNQLCVLDIVVLCTCWRQRLFTDPVHCCS